MKVATFAPSGVFSSQDMANSLKSSFGAGPSSESFSQILDGVMGRTSVHSFSSLPGDYATSFKKFNPTPSDKEAEPQGMAREVKEYLPNGEAISPKIDRTSLLYEKALELESYFVKIMTDSMRATLSEESFVGKESFASKMYKDMMYDELNKTLTQNAGFGLADHIYLQLNK